mmetsp:Transcript_42440/g.104008  ORF Transcript_42440/g.104008 Transcript_42440/m.104008 type:complete len:361 (+) Transcript_42440:207-1289(+)
MPLMFSLCMPLASPFIPFLGFSPPSPRACAAFCATSKLSLRHSATTLAVFMAFSPVNLRGIGTCWLSIIVTPLPAYSAACSVRSGCGITARAQSRTRYDSKPHVAASCAVHPTQKSRARPLTYTCVTPASIRILRMAVSPPLQLSKKPLYESTSVRSPLLTTTSLWSRCSCGWNSAPWLPCTQCLGHMTCSQKVPSGSLRVFMSIILTPSWLSQKEQWSEGCQSRVCAIMSNLNILRSRLVPETACSPSGTGSVPVTKSFCRSTMRRAVFPRRGGYQSLSDLRKSWRLTCPRAPKSTRLWRHSRSSFVSSYFGSIRRNRSVNTLSMPSLVMYPPLSASQCLSRMPSSSASSMRREEPGSS